MLKKDWFDPKARVCQECLKLEPMKDKTSGARVSGIKMCTKFMWEIPDKLAASQAVCRVPREKQHRRKAY